MSARWVGASNGKTVRKVVAVAALILLLVREGKAPNSGVQEAVSLTTGCLPADSTCFASDVDSQQRQISRAPVSAPFPLFFPRGPRLHQSPAKCCPQWLAALDMHGTTCFTSASVPVQALPGDLRALTPPLSPESAADCCPASFGRDPDREYGRHRAQPGNVRADLPNNIPASPVTSQP
jgi:hypothetical protein